MLQKNTHLDIWQLKYEPRSWQKSALDKWQVNYRGIVSVVTGGGKTVFAFLCILKYLQINTQSKVVVIVPTITLLDQWFLSFQDELGVKKEDIACFSGEEKPKEFQRINIMVINTARKIISQPNRENFFLIVDECHRAGSPINSSAIKGPFAATLGLSATPEREYDNGFYQFLVPNLGEIIYTYDYREALKDKVICQYELVNVEVELLPHEKQQYNKITKKIALLKKKEREALNFKQKLNLLLIKRSRISALSLMRLPVASRIVEQNERERIIIFHESIDAADSIYETLNKRKKSVTIYHSKIGKYLRRDNLRLYRQGRYNILVTCKALDEGMNAPETTVAIIASSTASTRQRIQRLGRVLRPAKGKDNARIYTLYATEQEREKLRFEFLKLNKEIKISWFKSRTNG